MTEQEGKEQEETKDYNGSSAILSKLEMLLGEETIPVNVAVRILLEAFQHQIKALHDVKMDAHKRLKRLEEGQRHTEEQGAKISLKSALQYGFFFYAIDRTGIIDQILSKGPSILEAAWKLLF